MEQMAINKKYFELRFEEKLGIYQAIAIKKNKNIEEIKKEYSSINEFYAKEIGCRIEEVLKSEQYWKQYTKIRSNYYSKKRKDLFLPYSNAIKLVKWWKEQKDQCNYCGITTSELHEIANNREYGKLTLNGLTKRSKGTLEIEQKTSQITGNDYKELENLILACPLCNNAKSNLISEKNWRKYFAIPMRNSYIEELGHELQNDIPQETLRYVNKKADTKTSR